MYRYDNNTIIRLLDDAGFVRRGKEMVTTLRERASFCARVRKVQSYYAPRARREYSEFDYGTLLLLRTDYCEMRGMRDKAARAEKATTRMPTATTS